jgi:HD-GYP domain-containing protein (c-di-GMP phosphodiesterase class II)
MSETQILLGKIAALRQRLEQASGLAREATNAAAALAGDAVGHAVEVQKLERQTTVAAEHDTQLDIVVRPLGAATEAPALPRLVTSRARRVLERGRELLSQLRALDDAFASPDAEEGPAPAPLLPRGEPLARLYRETLAITDSSLRMVPLFPESAAAQLHLCEGVEAVLGVVAQRVRMLTGAVAHRRRDAETIGRLAEIYESLDAGRRVDWLQLHPLAEAVLSEAEECGPLHILEAEPQERGRFVACHSLTTAQVIARLIKHEPDLRPRSIDAILAALLHDVGMMRVPLELSSTPNALLVEQRRAVEAHCRAGAELLEPFRSEAPWLIEAALSHHERLDGTGYPDGLREYQVSPLTRLLAVCDVYAAFCAARPHRAARPTRTALADTLLLAEQGLLDRRFAEHLLQLSFYPVGTAVEMADGAVGVVVATPMVRRDLNSPARPVVAVLLDGQGQPTPTPRHLDLAQCPHHSIVRSLSRRQRLSALGAVYPEWA